MEILHTLGINTQVILANVISFLLLYWLLSKFLFPPVRSIMRERKEGIEASYRNIQEQMAKAESRQAELDQRLTQIEADARTRIEQAGAEASKMRDEILKAARDEADRIRDRGIGDIERESEKALQTIRQHVADLVVQTSEKVLGQTISDDRHRQLIAQTLDQVEGSRN